MLYGITCLTNEEFVIKMKGIFKEIPNIILHNLSLFVSFSEIEKLFEAAIESSEDAEKKKKLASGYIESILVNIKTILSTLSKNFNKDKYLKKIKSK